MITTIPTYCKERGVTRQFVYEYIKRGKFKHFEMPVFIELNGDKIELGMQKVLEVPDEFAPKKTDLSPITEGSVGDLENLIRRLTDEPEVQNFYRNYLTLPPEVDKKAVKTAMYAKIEQHPKREKLRAAIDEANIRLMQHLVQMNDYMKDVLNSASVETANMA
jgi:hypothetical protein